MPLLKIYLDDTIGTDKSTKLAAALPSLRELLCAELNVDIAVCQFSIVPVKGLPDQAQVSVEMQILPKPERTRDVVLSVCEKLRDVLRELVEEKVAIRVTTLDPETYVVLR